MLHLPRLKIVRDEVAEVRLLEAARKSQEESDGLRTPGIHASDLLDPRLAYWQDAKPQPLSERSVWLFLVGRVLHYFILHSVDPALRDGATDTGVHEEFGILFSPDLLKEGRPIEVKTNRSIYEPREDQLQEDLGIYVEQLIVYCVLTNNLIGELWILYLNLKDAARRTWPEPRCYRIELTKEQFYTIEEQILTIRDLLLKAKADRTHAILPLCREWKCGEDRCQWWNECKPEGRWPEPNRKKWTQ